MDATREPGILAMADALVEAAEWSHSLYPDNAWCSEDERVSALVLLALGDGNERYRVEAGIAHTSLIMHANGRVLPMAPDASRAVVDASARATAPDVCACDYCGGAVGPIAGLLPVPAGASLPVLSLCGACLAFLQDTFPLAHYIALED